MLELNGVCKAYGKDDTKVQALAEVSISFRPKEFVAILGPSGCGKTTLLNIIGGLDNIDSGSMQLYGHETTEFTEKSWDNYRNTSIGFVFQNYNLVPHLSILENVMLTLALVDISKEEQIAKAEKALAQVGLGDQKNKMPNQISGGQAQRVAIARALVNDPDIILADEPTGALDSTTSVQVLDILKEISKDHLVIMVTHNQDLAEKYADRIVTMLDGRIVKDTRPHEALEIKQTLFTKTASMSFGTALRLSAKNLFAKKKRTLKTCAAGAIALAGMTFCLSLSDAIGAMFSTAFEEVPLVYTHTLYKSHDNIALSDMFGGALSEGLNNTTNADYTTVTVNLGEIASLLNSIGPVHYNDLNSFYDFLNTKGYDDFEVQTDKSIIPIMYLNSIDECKLISPISTKEILGEESFERMYSFLTSGMDGVGESTDLVEELDNLYLGVSTLPGKDFVDTIYSVSAGRLPENKNEGVLILTNTGNLNYIDAYALGLIDSDDVATALAGGEAVISASAEEVIGKELLLAGPSEMYAHENNVWVDHHDDMEFVSANKEDMTSVKIVGVIYPHIDATVMKYYPTIVCNTIAVPQETVLDLIERNNNTEIIKQAAGDYNPLAGGKYASDFVKRHVLEYLGYQDVDDITKLTIVATSEEGNEHFQQLLTEYNEGRSEEEQITEFDMMSSMGKEVITIMDSVGKIVAAILAVALIVSISMIGILLQVSVLERTKEIGLLRAIGASKKDIHHIFDAEAIVIGMISSIIGCGGASIFMLLLDVLIAVANRSFVIFIYPNVGAVIILIIANIICTYLAGRGPAKQAAKVTPITALRSE